MSVAPSIHPAAAARSGSEGGRAEIWIYFPRFAAQEGGQFVQCRPHATVGGLRSSHRASYLAFRFRRAWIVEVSVGCVSRKARNWPCRSVGAGFLKVRAWPTLTAFMAQASKREISKRWRAPSLQSPLRPSRPTGALSRVRRETAPWSECYGYRSAARDFAPLPY